MNLNSPSACDDALGELIYFLRPTCSERLKLEALQHLLGLTGSEDGRRQLLASTHLRSALIRLICTDESLVARDACLCLVNLSGSWSATEPLLAVPGLDTVNLLLRQATRPGGSAVADPCCMTLSNLTRQPAGCRAVWDRMRGDEMCMERIVVALFGKGYNKTGCKLDYLGPLLSNLTQLKEARSYVLARDQVVFQRLLPFINYQESLVLRGGVIGAIKNCCFETDSHEWLLGDDVDLLPRLLLPLTGPEPYDDEDMEKLPVDLQYMDESKTREPDVDIRKMLLEAITQLCATRATREIVRNKGTYLILREYHKWETDKEALTLCEELVNILIKTEEEIGVDDLKALEIPSDVASKLEEGPK